MKGLKITLWICALSCLLAFVYAALPWQIITAWFEMVNFQPPAAQPSSVYMTRVFLALFGPIGIFFVLLALNPLKYGAMLSLAAYGLICVGFICLAGGIRYKLPLLAFSIDMIFSLLAGVFILIFRKKALNS